MSNGRKLPRDIGGVPIRQPSRLDEVIHAVNALSDFTLAICAMCMEAGTFTSEQLFKMEEVLRDARRKLGPGFDTKEGIAAVRAAFRLEIQGEKSGK